MHPVVIDLGFFVVYSYGLVTTLGKTLGAWLFLELIAHDARDDASVERRHSTLLGWSIFAVVMSGLAPILFWSLWRRKRKDPVLLHLWIIPVIIIIGLIAGRLAWSIDTGDFGALIEFWRGGQILTVALLVMVTAGIVFSWLGIIRFWYVLDRLIPSVAAASAVSRIGCFLAGCDFGSACSGILCVSFPPGTPAPAGVPVHPVQLYYTVLLGLVAAAGALRVWRGVRFGGEVAALGCIGMAAVEIALRPFRGDVGSSFSIGHWLWMTVAVTVYAILAILALRARKRS